MHANFTRYGDVGLYHDPVNPENAHWANRAMCQGLGSGVYLAMTKEPGALAKIYDYIHATPSESFKNR